MSDQKVRLTGLYKHVSDNGTTYLTGRLGAGRLIVLKNGFKEKDTDPDYIVYIRSNTPKEDI
jgi:hypothetical protein